MGLWMEPGPEGFPLTRPEVVASAPQPAAGQASALIGTWRARSLSDLTEPLWIGITERAQLRGRQPPAPNTPPHTKDPGRTSVEAAACRGTEQERGGSVSPMCGVRTDCTWQRRAHVRHRPHELAHRPSVAACGRHASGHVWGQKHFSNCGGNQSMIHGGFGDL